MNDGKNPDYRTGYRGGDRLVGFLLALGCWLFGWVALMLAGLNVGPLVALLVYIGLLVYMVRSKGASTMAAWFLLGTLLWPIFLLLGFAGMCAIGGRGWR